MDFLGAIRQLLGNVGNAVNSINPLHAETAWAPHSKPDQPVQVRAAQVMPVSHQEFTKVAGSNAPAQLTPPPQLPQGMVSGATLGGAMQAMQAMQPYPKLDPNTPQFGRINSASGFRYPGTPFLAPPAAPYNTMTQDETYGFNPWSN